MVCEDLVHELVDVFEVFSVADACLKMRLLRPERGLLWMACP